MADKQAAAPLDRVASHAWMMRERDAKIEFLTSQLGQANHAITEIVRALKAGKSVAISDEWGDMATAYPEAKEGGAKP